MKIAVVMVLVAVAGIGVAQLAVLGTGGGSSGAVEQVPADVDSVTTIDMTVLEDETADRLYTEAYESVSEEVNDTEAIGMVPANLSALSDRVENESGLDPRDAEEVVYFQQQRENFTAPAYAGAVVHADWNESALLDIVANETDTDYENTTVDGVTVYRPNTEEEDEEFGFGPDPRWVGVLGDSEYVVGTENAVRDTIAVSVGNGSALSGDMLSAYQETRDGYLRSVQRSQNVNVTAINQTAGSTTGLNVTAYAEAYNDLHITASSSYTTDDGIGSQTRILTNSTATAEDVESLTQGFISIQAGAIQNETIKSELRAASVSRDGTTVTVTRETSVDAAVKTLEWYLSLLDAGEGAAPGAAPVA